MAPKITKTLLKYTFAILFVFLLTMFGFFQLFGIDRGIVVERVYSIPDYANMTDELESVLKNVSESIRLNTTAKEIAKLERTNVSYVKVGKVYYGLTYFLLLRLGN